MIQVIDWGTVELIKKWKWCVLRVIK